MAVETIVLYLVGWMCLLQTDALLKTEFYTKPGFRSDGASWTTVSVRSQIQCAAACAREPICSGYNYESAVKSQCQLLCGVVDGTPHPGWTVGYLQNNTDTYELGGLIQELSHDPARNLNIFLDLQFRSSGLVRKWIYFATRPGEFIASAWRRNGVNSFKLVDRQYLLAKDSGVGEECAKNNFHVQEGDVLAIQYKSPVKGTQGTAMVPYETSTLGDLCCNLQLGNLSRIALINMADEDLQVGSVLNVTVHSTKKLPALSADVLPIPQ